MTDAVVIPFPRAPKPRPTNAERVSQMDADWLRSFVPKIAQPTRGDGVGLDELLDVIATAWRD